MKRLMQEEIGSRKISEAGRDLRQEEIGGRKTSCRKRSWLEEITAVRDCGRKRLETACDLPAMVSLSM